MAGATVRGSDIELDATGFDLLRQRRTFEGAAATGNTGPGSADHAGKTCDRDADMAREVSGITTDWVDKKSDIKASIFESCSIVGVTGLDDSGSGMV